MVTKETLLECAAAFNRISHEAFVMLRTLNEAFDKMDEDFKRRAQNLNVIDFTSFVPTAERASANVALKPNKNLAFYSSKQKNVMENKTEMPKIKNISFYKRKNGYYRAVITFKGKRKDITGKDRNDVIERAKGILEDMGGANYDFSTNFVEFSKFWFENVKKPFISSTYYYSLVNRFNALIAPVFKGKRIKQIKAVDLQVFFNKLCKSSTRNAEDAKIMLNQIFEYAVENELIKVNPMRAVIVLKHERQNGSAFSREEISEFKAKLAEVPDCKIPFLVALYTGIRPTEIPTVQVDLEKGAISVLNAKKKQYQKKDRREIPIAPQLRVYSEEIAAFNFAALRVQIMERRFKSIMPDFELRELRHTFQTYARLTCTKEVVNLWTGHVLGSDMTDKVYNHIPWEEQKKQIETLNF